MARWISLRRPSGSLLRKREWITFRRPVDQIYVDDRKMTSLPAARLNITDRGYVKQGFKADIVVFDPVTIKDNATFESPRVYPSGIDHVVVNGVPVVAEGKHTEAKPGIVLRHSV
jgi:N-acyl-D-aspartate/D-glutamate deacylase